MTATQDAAPIDPGPAPWNRVLPNGAPYWTKNYQPGVPATIETPTGPIQEILDRAVAEAGDHVATEFFGAKMTYAQLGSRVQRAAEGLRQAGVKAGDRVAIVLPNCPQHLIAFYAITRLGAVVVEHNPLYTSRELDTMFADHGATVAIAMDSVIGKLTEISAEHRPTTIISVNLLRAMPAHLRLALSLPLPPLRKMRAKLSDGTPGDMSFEQLIASPPLSHEHPYPGVGDLAAIQYTSGTTGRPKGAMLTHANLVANARQGEAWMHGAPVRATTSYAILPFFHAFGITNHITFGVLKQQRQVLFPTPDVDLILKAARRHPPTIVNAVPIMYERIATEASRRGISLVSARWCISGAMALPDATRTLWEDATSGLLVEGYGLTESSPVALGNPFHSSRRPGTIGVPFPSVGMKVVRLDDPQREVGVHEPGELLLSGPQIFGGYWHDQASTEQVLLPGGWLRTGDVVTVDDDGFVSIVDRVKELIITGGFNVSPNEVETELRRHEFLVDVAVVGVPQPRGDEQVIAAVVPEPGHAVDEPVLRAWAKERLAGYKVPRRFVTVEELPRNMMGKISRAEVKTRMAELLDA